MNAYQLELACLEGAMENRYRLMKEAIERGDSKSAGEHAEWCCFCGIELLAERAGVVDWQFYTEVHDWWNGGQNGNGA